MKESRNVFTIEQTNVPHIVCGRVVNVVMFYVTEHTNNGMYEYDLCATFEQAHNEMNARVRFQQHNKKLAFMHTYASGVVVHAYVFEHGYDVWTFTPNTQAFFGTYETIDDVMKGIL